MAVARARLKDRRQEGSRQEILAAAREVLPEVGVSGLTVDVVARRLGVTKQALYHYYTSKIALVLDLCLHELGDAAQAVHAACQPAPDGAAALEALIRSYVQHWAPRLDMFRLCMQQIQELEGARMTAADLARLRPLNDLMFGPAEDKLTADRRAGRAGKRINPRRLAFTAYLAATGLLSMKALVEGFNDPLKWSDSELVDELCGAFRAAARGGGSDR